MRSGAYIYGPYRYFLWREWGGAHHPMVLWIMLNPSTADAEVDDPTIRRCIRFSKEWGFAGLYVCNLFALRATDPRILPNHDAPIGPENNWTISSIANRSARVVVAWGNRGSMFKQDKKVTQLLQRGRQDLWCLGRTKNGSPRHPLYVPSSTKLVEYAGDQS